MSQLLGLLVPVILAVGAGVSLVIQQVLNANLRMALGSTAWAGFVSYFAGTLCMVALAAALGDNIPTVDMASRSNWWAWAGGVFGAIYIALAILLIPRLGAAAFIALLIGGQLLTSMIIDHYGLFGVPEHPANAFRLFGALLLMAGAVLIRF
ncbi:MAG: DMT family transporter [Rhodomicrobium sp.]